MPQQRVEVAPGQFASFYVDPVLHTVFSKLLSLSSIALFVMTSSVETMSIELSSAVCANLLLAGKSLRDCGAVEVPRESFTSAEYAENP